MLVLVLLEPAPGAKRVPFTTGPSDAAVVVSEASVVVMEDDIAAAGQSRRGRAKTMNDGSGDRMTRMMKKKKRTKKDELAQNEAAEDFVSGILDKSRGAA